MNWETPLKPAEIAEKRLVESILDNTFPIDSTLPPERELSTMLGVTRPTLREALQRLARDGWVEIHQGKPTRIRNYWKEGNLSVLSSISKYSDKLNGRFVINLLETRALLCPTYTQQAVQNHPNLIYTYLSNHPTIDDNAEEFTTFDWRLHQILTQNSNNPIFTLILNGFEHIYFSSGPLYFSINETKQISMHFYQELKRASSNQDHDLAYSITKETMIKNIDLMKSLL